MHRKSNITRTPIVIATAVCVIASVVAFESRPARKAPAAVPHLSGSSTMGATKWTENAVSLRGAEAIQQLKQKESGGKENTARKLEGAREYLEQTDEGQSLMQAVTAARFGLKWQENPPFVEEGKGNDG